MEGEMWGVEGRWNNMGSLKITQCDLCYYELNRNGKLNELVN